jgi:hypothetical protein
MSTTLQSVANIPNPVLATSLHGRIMRWRERARYRRETPVIVRVQPTPACTLAGAPAVPGSPATTDANGNYSITSITTCSSPVELIAASGSGTTELDEATGTSIPVSFTALKAYLATVGSTNVQHITPLTHIVAM